MKAVNKRPLHPFFLASYPILALLGHNIEIVNAAWALRPLLLSICGAGILLLMLHTFRRDWPKAALITSLTLAFFYSYGHVYTLLEGSVVAGMTLGRHRYLAPLWMLLFSLGLVWSLQTKRNLLGLTTFLNAMTAITLVFPLAQIGRRGINYLQNSVVEAAPSTELAGLHLPAKRPAPDIYYIILDGYGRDDMLRKHYDLDNHPFLDHLRQLGFYVAECSQSNYAQTQLSLASSLNFNYLENLDNRYTPDNTSRIGLADLIKDSAIRRALTGLGYQTVAFESGYEATQIEDSDKYYSLPSNAGMNEFEYLLMRTTAGRLLSEGIAYLNLPPDWEARDQAHRERVHLILDTLPGLPEEPEPKFVFAHIIAPHWPHVFGPHGEAVHERPDSVSGYRNQVIFINHEIEPILAEIIRRSKRPPIIILQADHGSIIESPSRRMSILNAYYLPGDADRWLYANISPVNTFRLILNTYFSAGLPYLEDQSYYSQYEEPYKYQLVPNRRPGCEVK